MLQFCLFGVEFPIVIDMMPQMLHLVIWHALRNGISVCKCLIIENAAMVIIIMEIIALSSCYCSGSDTVNIPSKYLETHYEKAPTGKLQLIHRFKFDWKIY